MALLTRTQRRALAAVLGAAFVLRVWWCLYAAREPVGLADPGLYRLLASGLADLDGYELEGAPTAYYPVGYPAVLGAVFWLGGLVGIDGAGGETFLVAALNVLAGTAAVLLAFVLGRRTAGAWAGIVAAAIVAVAPNLVFHSALALSETVFVTVALAAAVVLAGASWQDGPGRRLLVAAGALLGAAALVRPVAVPVVALLPLVWFAAGFGWRRALRDVAVVGLTAALVIAPWTVRNAVRLDTFVPISTNTGDNLCMSRQPGANGGFLLTEHCFGGPALEGLVRPEYELARDRQARRLGLEFIREHPGRELRLWLDRLGASFNHDHDGIDAAESYGLDRFLSGGTRDLLRRLADAAWYVLGVLGLLAAIAVVADRRLRRDPRLVLLVVTTVGLLVPIVLFFGDARFKVPAVPFLAVLVPSVLARLRRDRRAAAGAAG
jgi:4-amino-4-deoxy-L-arabinose transferase-like glycosyltransferase